MFLPVGMIDWLTLILEGLFLDADTHKKCMNLSDKIMRISPDGEVRWTSNCRESIRSDSHQVTISFGSTIRIMGSPARIHHCNNVFGSLDIQQCALDMITYVCEHYDIILPRNLKQWKCSKIDITQNFDMGSKAQCQQVIDHLKMAKYGRQKLSTFETSVEWGKGSALQMLKAYMKGEQCLKLIRDKSAFFTDEEISKAHKLVRLEYSLRRIFILRLREAGLNWYDLTPEHLIALHTHAFSKLISDIEVTDMDNILDKLLVNVGKGEHQIPTLGQAQAAYDCYMRCRTIGFKQAQESFTRPTWTRHLKNLSTIGIKAPDLQPSNVVPFRRRAIVLDQPVSCWADIKLP
jgi:II/X family phage/plasmid replication protein